jgi:predicted metal-dependent phosphoesterase TrpH
MIDLHLHSTFSDGTFTPTELVRMARQRHLSAISITDHDTVEGTDEAMAAGETFGIRVLSGVELSVFDGDTHFHLLGYNCNWNDTELRDGLKKLQGSRQRRNSMIISRLRDLGIAVSEAELAELSSTGQTGRPHIARLLVNKKIVKTIDQAFDLYLKKGRSAYARRFIYHVDEAIGLIHGSGGTAVLAHPLQISSSIEIIDTLLKRLKASKLDGVETFYPTQKGRYLKQLRRLVATHGLFETGGSDYHGDIRPNTAMAGGAHVRIPLELLEAMDRYHEKRRVNHA